MSRIYSDVAEQLIAKAREGDRQAEEELICMYQPLIGMLARRLWCTHMSREDLMQAGNLGLMQAVRRYNPTREAGLTTYAVPWILGEMRRMMKQMEICRISLDEPVGDAHQTLHDVLAGSTDLDIRQIDLQLAMQSLSGEERILLCLRYFRDHTQKETAALLGKSQAQISKAEHRALDALRAKLS